MLPLLLMGPPLLFSLLGQGQGLMTGPSYMSRWGRSPGPPPLPYLLEGGGPDHPHLAGHQSLTRGYQKVVIKRAMLHEVLVRPNQCGGVIFPPIKHQCREYPTIYENEKLGSKYMMSVFEGAPPPPRAGPAGCPQGILRGRVVL